jgi:hypothetical protein
VALLPWHGAEAVTPPLTNYGPSGTGFVNISTLAQGKAGNVLELAGGSQLVLSVDYQLTPYVGTKMVLHKLTPMGLPDVNWQQAGKRELSIVQGGRLTLQWTTRVAVVQTPTGFLVIQPNQYGVAGVWIQAIDATGNDANIFGGFPFKFVVATGVPWTDSIDSFSLVNDAKRSRVLVLGTYATSGGGLSNFVGAIGYNGQAVTSFASQGFHVENVSSNVGPFWRDLAYSNEGVFISGNSVGPDDPDFTVTKLALTTGIPDTSFGAGGTRQFIRTGSESHPHIILSSAGILLVGGRYPLGESSGESRNLAPDCCAAALFPETAVARVLYNGNLDSSFGVTGWVDIQNPEYMAITDLATRYIQVQNLSHAHMVFSALGEESATAGIAGNLDVTTDGFGNGSASMSLLTSIAQCQSLGLEWPVSLTVGESNAMYVNGVNICNGGTYRPFVSKHLVQ